MNLKVCILPFRISSSGAASYTIELANAAVHSGLSVVLVGCGINMRIEEIDPGVERIDVGNDPVKLMYAGGPIIDHIVLSRKLKEAVERHIKDFDVLHFTLASSSLFFGEGFVTTAWLPLDALELMKLHSVCFRFPKSFLANIALMEYSFMEAVSFNKASRIIGLIKTTYEGTYKKYPKKAALIPPPIDGRSKHEGSGDDKPHLLFIARDLDYPRKNLKAVLKALNILFDRGIKDFKLFIVGNGTNVMPIINGLRNKGLEIVCLGRLKRNDVLELMDKSDIFISPNIYEELNYSTLEALGSGLPLVASDIPPFKDLVVDGKNGYLVSATDYRILAKKLEELIMNHDLRESMSKASLRLAKLNFSYEVVGEKLRNLYYGILNEE